MAPERFNGVSDPRTDVYALGVTLYELLTLRPAFPVSDRVLLIHQIAKEEPARPRAIDPTIPRDLETIVLKSIEKDPGRRYPTATEMAEDLRRFLADRPIKARRASWREPAWRWCRRNKAVAWSLASAVAFLLLLVVGLSVAAAVVWHAKQDVEQAKAEVEMRLAEEKQSAYFQRIALAERELAANNLARADELLELCPPELRRWEWYYLKRSRGKPPLVSWHDHPVSGMASLSPSGRHVATAGSNGAVTIWDTVTGRPVRVIAAHTNRCWMVVYSPDGKVLASSDETTDKSVPAGEIKFWNPETGTLLRTVTLPRRFVTGMEFSPDGQRLATATYQLGANEEAVVIREVTTGHILVSLANHDAATQGLSFSPDGRLLASASGDNKVRVSDAQTGRVVWEYHDRRPGKHPSGASPSARRAPTRGGYGPTRSRIEACGSSRCKAVANSGRSLGTRPRGRLQPRRAVGHRWPRCDRRIWDPDRGEQLLTLRGFTDVVRSVNSPRTATAS